MLLLSLFACNDYAIENSNAIEGGDSGGWTSEDHPVAECSVSPNPVAPPFESAVFDGRASWDPNGLSIDKYEWELLSKPDGSAVDLHDGDDLLEGFMPDLAGEYTASLVVTNSEAMRSQPCTVTLSAEPSEDLWIELYWAAEGDDLDLHLLRPDGELETDGDCYFYNCKDGLLDWGNKGDLSDNPQLDLDDIQGNGPENINVSGLEKGVYTIVVHDYPTSIYEDDNNATVNVYIDGTLQWSATKVFQGEGSYVEFATVDWTTGDVVTSP